MRFRLHDAAKHDLAEIWLGTAERWGVDQADDDIRAVEDRLGRICDFPEDLPIYACSHGSFRKAPSGQHLIFCTFDETTIEVVRVLHNQMDAEAGLG